jgi:hypothetical protein
MYTVKTSHILRKILPFAFSALFFNILSGIFNCCNIQGTKNLSCEFASSQIIFRGIHICILCNVLRDDGLSVDKAETCNSYYIRNKDVVTPDGRK